MKSQMTAGTIDALRSDLNLVRQASLHATRTGDYKQVARLTVKAAQLNQFIQNAHAELDVY